ncbi:MAG: DoxX family protein, partial [Candidatus Bipolaricaulia bacterium]
MACATRSVPKPATDRVRRVVASLAATDRSAAALTLRLTLAVVMFPHGGQKLFGWFGGPGLGGTMAYFESIGLPAAVGALTAIGEVVLPVLLLAGLMTRIGALSIGAIMLGAVATQHWAYGFFMNWTGMKAGEGIEYHLLALGIVLALGIQGGGRLSLDRRL